MIRTLGRVFAYLLSFSSQILDLIYWTVWITYFDQVNGLLFWSIIFWMACLWYILWARYMLHREMIRLQSANPPLDSSRRLRCARITHFQSLVICQQFKLNSIQVDVKAFTCPNKSQRLFLCLEITALHLCQTSTSISNNTFCSRLPVDQNCPQTYGASICNGLGLLVTDQSKQVSQP